MTLEKLKEWKSEEAKMLKKLLKKGVVDDTEYQVRKIQAKDR